MKTSMKKWANLLFLVLFLAFIAIGCGSSGGRDSGSTPTPTPPPDPTPVDPVTPSDNLSGTIYTVTGATVSGATVYVFSPTYTTTTDSSGRFSLLVSKAMHTILVSRPGYIDTLSLADLSAGNAVSQSFMVYESIVSPVGALATREFFLTSNSINGRQANLYIPIQSAGTFTIGTQKGLSHADISLEYIDLSDPMPLPMPGPSNLAPSDVLIGTKQAPSVLVQAKPSLLELGTSATLTLPNPNNLIGVRILYFNPDSHLWQSVGATDNSPSDGTPIAISKGGFYGIFYETPKVSSLRGTAAPGSLIIVGDEIVQVGSDGSFFVKDVPIPPDGNVNLLNFNPSTGKVTQSTVDLVPNQVITVDISQVVIGSITMKSDAETLVATGTSQTKIQASVKNNDGSTVPDGTRVLFTTTGGTLSASFAETINGIATLTLTSTQTIGIVNITASAGGITGSISIEFIDVPSSISLSTSKTSIKSDGTDSAEITVTVLNDRNAPFENVPVRLNSSGGMISASQGTTDSGGIVSITFQASTSMKKNETVMICAEVDGLPQECIPIRVVGTTVTLNSVNSNLDTAGLNKDTLTISVKDASQEPIWDADVNINCVPENSLIWKIINPDTGKTDTDGTLKIEVLGKSAVEEAVLKISVLGATAAQTYKVTAAEQTFSIIEPDKDPVSISTNQELTITVRAPKSEQKKVRFSTTLGSWKNGANDSKTKDVDVSEAKASAIFTCNIVGTATIQVFDIDDPSTNDSVKVAVSAPSSEAAKISLQVSPSVIAPSTADITSTATLRATLKNNNDQVVGSAPIAFSISNTTGGGEFLSPVIVLTNSSGIAETTFTAGYLSSSSEGVIVEATVIGTSIKSTTKIIIGGTATSIWIGYSTEAEQDVDKTLLKLPISILVSDANNNPVPNLKVSIGAWPVEYVTGYWVGCPGGCCPAPTPPPGYSIAFFPNEDLNRNLILDPGEDLNFDGVLTPPNSAGGNVPESVTTNEDGTATFNLTYVKEAAPWIKTEITASAFVYGSETRSSRQFYLPYLGEDAQKCLLPHSRYNPDSDDTPDLEPVAITLTADPASIPADGTQSSIINAEIIDGLGNHVKDGTDVTITVNYGTLSADNSQTIPPLGGEGGVIVKTLTGIASASLTGTGYIGAATITAKSGSITNSINVEFIPGPPSSADVRPEFPNVSADGTSSTEITAFIYDANNNPVSDSHTIIFEISRTDGKNPGTLSERTALTSNGAASVTYTASTEPTPDHSPVIITVKSGNTVIGTSEITLINILIRSVTIEKGADSIPADGASDLTIRATVTDTNGNLVHDTPVTFTTTLGTPETQTKRTVNGIAEVRITSAAKAGTATITATAGGVSSKTTVNFTSGTASSLTLSFNPENIVTNSGTSSIKAKLSDSNGNPIASERITFEAAAGTLSAYSAPTDIDGFATVTYTAPSTAGTYQITAKSSNGTTARKSITVINADVSSIKISAPLTDIIADGRQTLITATVKDLNNKNIADGTIVNFSINPAYGHIPDSASTSNGSASVSLTAPTKIGAATITATAGGISATLKLNFIAGTPVSNKMTITANPSSLTIGENAKSVIRVQVKDSNNNYVSGETLTFQVDYGTLSATTAVTSADGTATVDYTMPNYVPQGGKDFIRVQTTSGISPPAPCEIDLTGPQIASIELSVNPPTLPADGKSQATISAKLTLVGGGDAPDGTPVYFKISQSSGGSFDGNKMQTSKTAKGIAIAKLTSGTKPETITIRAGTAYDSDTGEIRGIIQEVDIKFTPGSVTVIVIPNSILGTGKQSAAVTATLKDSSGRLVSSGLSVEFVLSDQKLGRIDSPAITNQNGEAHTTFYDLGAGGTVTITARWNTDPSSTTSVFVTGSADINIQPPPAFINVSTGFPDPQAINIKGTGGQSTSQIVFEVKDSQGAPVADGYRINFSILSGPNGGESIAPPFAFTNKGLVGTVLRSGHKSGPVSIKAQYADDSNISTTTSQIAIEAGPPVGEEFGIGAQYVNVSGWWRFGLKDTIWVNAGDVYGNAIPDNTRISFKTYNTGGLFDPGSASTKDGFAESYLFSTDNPTPMQGFLSVTAEANNGGRTTHVTSLAVIPEDRYMRDNFIIYAGTDGGGIYKSNDSGTTWDNISRSSTLQGQNWIHPYVNDIAVDPDNINIVYAATGYLGSGNLYRSLDSGMNWNSNNIEEFNGVFVSDAEVTAVLCDDDGSDSENDRFVWIGTKGMGAFFSLDGKNFQWGGKVEPVFPTISENIQDVGTIFSNGDSSLIYMTYPVLSPSSITEQWTVSYDSSSSNWIVRGSRSGGQSKRADTYSTYTSDNNEISFLIKGFNFGDSFTFTFNVTESGLGYGKNVYEIVKVKNTHKNSAVLYAATGSGVFRSSDGGLTWLKPSSFAGDSVNTLIVHPYSNGGASDILFAGTEDSGIWVSTDSGRSWTAHNSGLGYGLSASYPTAGNYNVGTGLMDKVVVLNDCKSENWTIACISADADGAVFRAEGTISGFIELQNQCSDPKKYCYQIPNIMNITINEGSTPFASGDIFTFSTTRDPGRRIKDLLIDTSNNFLYAITYFLGTLEAHAVGNVYVHDLDPDHGTMLPGHWRQANSQKLPQYDPPDDTTTFAQHVIASSEDVNGNTNAIFIGGEGINLFKATDGLKTGTPDWRESKSGLTNLIMARMPIVFTGYCGPDLSAEVLGEQDGKTTYKYVLYLQDENGNPPVAGTKLSVYLKWSGVDIPPDIIMELTYPDAYAYRGTWRDPSDPKTNLPFVFVKTHTDSQYVDVVVTYTPCATAPGCSG